jgi:hypothetical protein
MAMVVICKSFPAAHMISFNIPSSAMLWSLEMPLGTHIGVGQVHM